LAQWCEPERARRRNRDAAWRHRAADRFRRAVPDAARRVFHHRRRCRRGGNGHSPRSVDQRRHVRCAVPEGAVPGHRVRPCQRDDAQSGGGGGRGGPEDAHPHLPPHRAGGPDRSPGMSSDAEDIARQAAPIGHGRLQWRILIGFLSGLALGLIAYTVGGDAVWVDWLVAYVTGPIGQIFLRLLFMLVLPLLFAALVVGISEMGEVRTLRRIGLLTLGYTVIVSSIAVAISLAVVNLLRPGDGVDPAAARELLAQGGEGARSIIQASAESEAGMNALVAIVPSNVVQAMSNNDILAVMFFALAFGVGLLLVQTPRTAQLKDTIEGLFEVAMKLIGLVIQLAPIAIFCFMFNL